MHTMVGSFDFALFALVAPLFYGLRTDKTTVICQYIRLYNCNNAKLKDPLIKKQDSFQKKICSV